MGNICTGNEREDGTETVDTVKNSLYAHVNLGSSVSVELVQGSFRQHRSEALLIILEANRLQHYECLKDYCTNSDRIVESIGAQRKVFFVASPTKQCPYKKVLLCVLPLYVSQDAEDYKITFTNVVKELGELSREVTLELNATSQSVHTLPNQLLLSLLFKELATWSRPFKLFLLTPEKKFMAMYKFELLKTEQCVFKYVNAPE